MKKLSLTFILCCFIVVCVSANPTTARNRRLSNGVNRAVLSASQRNELLVDAASNPRALGQMRRLLNQGADPCRALPFAVFSNNVAGVQVLSEYKNRCNWNHAVQERLQYVMKKDLTPMFYALMADNRGITCPDPFDFTPAKRGTQWHPLSSSMLAAVNQRCFATHRNQAAFLNGIILLNPSQNNVFALGENYQFGINSQDTQQRWLANINQLIDSHVKVSNDTLQNVISQSRVPNTYGASNVPFDTTRKLVKLCLKGGANGKTVLSHLDREDNAWIWANYSSDERMRLSNILENKPETQARSFTDTLRKAYHKFF
ncbi:MAG: hypothetical protein IJ876_06780 [Elusimicrobiaceae bacterium]|nr:hypothetical protein [Elusimicrobiaceae bacterium]